jgi:tRNA A58 N-methylase Trm61
MNPETKIHILYPDDRHVTVEIIVGWAKDYAHDKNLDLKTFADCVAVLDIGDVEVMPDTMKEFMQAQSALITRYPTADQWLKSVSSNSKRFAHHPIWQLVNRRNGAVRSLLHKVRQYSKIFQEEMR